MSGIAASKLLLLPVRVQGVEIGRPVDAIVDQAGTRVLGLDVLCRDGKHRFLPLSAASVGADAIAVGSPLTLLAEEQLDFYRRLGVRLRELVPGLQDAWVHADGGLELVIPEDAA